MPTLQLAPNIGAHDLSVKLLAASGGTKIEL